MRDNRGPVVVGVDGSEGNDTAVRWAATEARTRGLPLRLVGIFRQHLPAAAAPMGAGWPVTLPAVARAETEKQVARAATIARGFEPGLEVGTEVIEGDATLELLTESAGAELVVVGSRHRQALGSLLFGSVGTAVAPRASCPVVVVRGRPGEREVGAWTVAGVDGGPGDHEVLEYAFEHAHRYGTRLKAVMCWQPHLTQPAHWSHDRYAQARQEARERITEQLAGWQDKYPGVRTSAAIVNDHAAPGLVAEGHGAHLLVVGSRRQHAVTGTLLGSTSQAVLHHATCPVAIVHTGH